MFFATQIKSLGNGGAIDMQGRKLIFIGYLPCQVGDWVYTDGNVIFGNAPPKGSPMIFDVPKGVPVLGDTYLLSSEQEALRGYFTRNGKYKRYDVAIDDWIVNSEKKFLHGSETFDRQEIIDADIAEDGGNIIATKGFYENSRFLVMYHPAISLRDSRTWGGYWDYVSFDMHDYNPHTIIYHSITGEEWVEVIKFSGSNAEAYWSPICTPAAQPIASKQILGSGENILESISAKIFINDTQCYTLDFAPYAEDVESRALICAEKLMEQSWDTESYHPYYSYEGQSFYVYQHPEEKQTISLRPDKPFIAHTRAHILTVSVDVNGFNAIIFATSYGFCFPYIQSRLKRYIATSSGFRKTLREWKCIPFGFSCFYQVQSTGESELEPLAFRDYGGIDTDLTVLGDEFDGFLVDQVSGATGGRVSSIIKQRHLELVTNFVTQDLEYLFPVGSGFYTMDKYGLLCFYNSEKNLVANNIPVHKDFYHVEIQTGLFQPESYLFYLNDKPEIEYNVYTTDGNIEEKIYDELQDTIPPMDGYYIKKLDDTFEPLQFTPLFYEFKDGSYLYGIRGGKLYFKNKDGEQIEVADGVKNFRLRELKNMSKAKK